MTIEKVLKRSCIFSSYPLTVTKDAKRTKKNPTELRGSFLEARQKCHMASNLHIMLDVFTIRWLPDPGA